LPKEAIDALQADNIALRKRQAEKLTEIAQRFQAIEDATKHKFLSFMAIFRDTARHEIAAHKRALQQANQMLREQHEQQEQSALRIAGLEELLREDERNASNASEDAQANMAAAESRHTEVSS